MQLAEHVAHLGKKRNAHELLVWKPKGDHLEGMCGWEDIIKMYLKEIEWQDVIGFIRLRIFTSDRLLPTW
jgi:hypothetical protein